MAKRLGRFGVNRLEEWRKRRGLSRAALAQMAGTVQGQIQKLELGERRLTLEWMQRLAAALSIEPSELMPREGAKRSPLVVGQRNVSASQESPPVIYIDGEAYVALPTQSTSGALVPLPPRKVYSLAFLRSLTSSAPESLMVFRARGDAMAPAITDQSLLLVDRGAAFGRAGLYAIRNGDEIEVRRVAMNPATHRVDLLADNPAYPAALDLDPASLDLVGRVLLVSNIQA